MELHRESCFLFDDVFLLEINNKNLSFECSHYMVHYSDSPLKIRIVPSLFAVFSQYIKIVITAVYFSCPPFHKKYAQCPNQPLICISRSLFCDSIDNCGMEADESDCISHLQHISVTLIDQQTQLHMLFLFVLISCLVCFAAILGFVIYRYYLLISKGTSRSHYYKNYITNMFGSFKRAHVLESGEAEETVALLTLGLNSILPHLTTPKLSKNNFNCT